MVNSGQRSDAPAIAAISASVVVGLGLRVDAAPTMGSHLDEGASVLALERLASGSVRLPSGAPYLQGRACRSPRSRCGGSAPALAKVSRRCSGVSLPARPEMPRRRAPPVCSSTAVDSSARMWA